MSRTRPRTYTSGSLSASPESDRNAAGERNDAMGPATASCSATISRRRTGLLTYPHPWHSGAGGGTVHRINRHIRPGFENADHRRATAIEC